MRAFSPQTLDEVVRYLDEEPDLRPIAGCTDLMVASPDETLALPAVLDLTGVPEIRGIQWQGDRLEIGAATTFSQIGRSIEVDEHFPALGEAARVIGGWQIQNRATLGGNIANASPAGDSLPVLMALDAEVVLVGPRGERIVPYTAFHTDYRQTALAHNEIIAWIRLPSPTPGSRQFFRKVGTRQAHAISKVVVALVARVSDGIIAEYRLAAGSVAAMPVRLASVELSVVGQPVGNETADLAGRVAGDSVQPIDDVRSTAAYRRFALVRVVRRLTMQLFRT